MDFLLELWKDHMSTVMIELHHFEMHNLKLKESQGKGSNNYVELFHSKSWLNLHERGLWNKFKYLIIIVSSLVGCKEIL